MTYHSDPPRWTDTSGHAPELLREGLEAANREGPSELQMRSLALKLAAVGAGAALTVASAKATSAAAGASLTTTGSSALSKIAVSMALVGAAATGGSWLLHRPSELPMVTRELSPVVAPLQAKEPSHVAPPTQQRRQPVATPLTQPVTREAVAAPTGVDAVVATELAEPLDATGSGEGSQAELDRAERRKRRHEQRAEAERAAQEPVSPPLQVRAPSLEIVNVKGQPRQLSEIDLLTKARAALTVRPHDAYGLTEQHKSLYPQGMFAQERDALAVEALQRAGDLRRARELAQSFLTHYPNSPAAHRFRETMNLP